MKLRTLIFWMHLTAGVLAGTVILVMSVTGALLAFERQIIAFAEADLRTVTPPAFDAPRLSLDIQVAGLEAVQRGQTLRCIGAQSGRQTRSMGPNRLSRRPVPVWTPCSPPPHDKHHTGEAW